jgi:hypothetical protein
MSKKPIKCFVKGCNKIATHYFIIEEGSDACEEHASADYHYPMEEDRNKPIDDDYSLFYRLAWRIEIIPFDTIHKGHYEYNNCNWICTVTCFTANFLFKLNSYTHRIFKRKKL